MLLSYTTVQYSRPSLTDLSPAKTRPPQSDTSPCSNGTITTTLTTVPYSYHHDHRADTSPPTANTRLVCLTCTVGFSRPLPSLVAHYQSHTQGEREPSRHRSCTLTLNSPSSHPHLTLRIDLTSCTKDDSDPDRRLDHVKTHQPAHLEARSRRVRPRLGSRSVAAEKLVSLELPPGFKRGR